MSMAVHLRVMVGATTMVLPLMSLGHVVAAQRASASAAFEVVSIRPVANSPFSLSQAGQTLLRITQAGQLVGRADLRGIIILAYGVETYERIVAIQPGASRLLEQFFEVRALPPDALSPPNPDEVKAMARQMLAERFGLRVRIDTEPARAMVLRMIEPGVLGPGLRPAPEGCTRLPSNANPYDAKFADAYRRNCGLTMFGGRFRGVVTLDEFARRVSFRAGQPILNRTGLEGAFAIDVAIDMTSLVQDVPSRLGARAVGPAGQNDARSFVEVLRDEMGVSARTESQPVRLFVVEHVGPLVEN